MSSAQPSLARQVRPGRPCTLKGSAPSEGSASPGGEECWSPGECASRTSCCTRTSEQEGAQHAFTHVCLCAGSAAGPVEGCSSRGAAGGVVAGATARMGRTRASCPAPMSEPRKGTAIRPLEVMSDKKCCQTWSPRQIAHILWRTMILVWHPPALLRWGEWDSNPHGQSRPAEFKSAASAIPPPPLIYAADCTPVLYWRQLLCYGIPATGLALSPRSCYNRRP